MVYKNTSDIKSPCVNICKVDSETRLCIGCYRSIDEISVWKSLSEYEIENIISELESRKNEYTTKTIRKN